MLVMKLEVNITTFVSECFKLTNKTMNKESRNNPANRPLEFEFIPTTRSTSDVLVFMKVALYTIL